MPVVHCIRHKQTGEFLRAKRSGAESVEPLYGPLELAWKAESEFVALTRVAFLDDSHEVVGIEGSPGAEGNRLSQDRAQGAVFAVACRADEDWEYVTISAGLSHASGGVDSMREVLKFRSCDDMEELRDLLALCEKCVLAANSAECRGVLEGLRFMIERARNEQGAVADMFVARAQKAVNVVEGPQAFTPGGHRRAGFGEGRLRDLEEGLAIARVFEPYPADDEVDPRTVL